MRQPLGVLGLQTDLAQQLLDPRRRPGRSTTACARSASVIAVPTRMRGSSVESGSWNTIWTLLRYAFSCAPPCRERVDAVEARPSPGQARQPHDRPADRRLARAALADQAEPGRPRRHAQRDAVDRHHGAVRTTRSRTSSIVTSGSAQPRHRRQQLARVGVGGVAERLRDRAALDDLAVAHDRDALADPGHHGQVVADEQDGQRLLARSPCSTSSISACTVTSRALVGSSASSTSARSATASAMANRCAWPPESWCG